VSRLWRERLLVSLAAGEVCWLRFGGLTKRRVLAKRAIQVDPNYGPEPWQGAVAALRTESEAWNKDALSVSVVLSNHFVRYALVPPSKGVSGAEEELALARYHFSRLYGEQSQSWEIRLSADRSNGQYLASAIDPGLLQSLRDCFPEGKRARLVSVQPLLMSAFNCWRAQFPKSGAWFLLLESERACLALMSGRTWATVQNVKGQYPDVQAWTELLDRERWRTSLERVPDQVFIHAPRAPASPLPHHDHWKLHALQAVWLQGLSPLDDFAYSTALTAA